MPRKTTDDIGTDIQKNISEALSDTTRQITMAKVADLINKFLKNDQWWDIDPATKAITQITRPQRKNKQRERVTANIMYPIWKTYKALIMQDIPHVSAIPEDPKDFKDLYAIDFAVKIVKYLIDTTLSNEQLLKICNILFSYGGVYLYSTVQRGRNGNQAVNEIIPPNQIFPWPLGVTDLNNALGMAWARMVPVDILKEDHPNEDFGASSTPDYLIDDNSEPGGRRLALVVDWYRKPTKNNPGCYSRTINSKLTLDFEKAEKFLTGYPFDHNELPFDYCAENDIYPDTYGFPSLELVLGQQVTYNMAESLLAELRKFLPKLLVPKQTGIEPRDVYSKLDDVLEFFEGMGVPHFIAPPQGSPGLYNSSAISQQAEHTLGLHGTTLRGESIGSVQSGEGIKSLQKQDEARSSPLKMNLLILQQKYFRKAYSNIKQFYSTKQIKAILGDKAELYYRAFKTISLSPMTFKIDSDYLYPKNPMVDRQMAIQIAQYGGIDMKNPSERRAWLKMVAPQIASQIDADVLEENRARLENNMLFERDVVPDDLDNDQVHIQVINEICKDPLFSGLDKMVKSRFQAHRRIHMDREKEKFEKIMAAQKDLNAKTPATPGAAETVTPAPPAGGQ